MLICAIDQILSTVKCMYVDMLKVSGLGSVRVGLVSKFLIFVVVLVGGTN